MSKFFNTTFETFELSMSPDGVYSVRTVDEAMAVGFLSAEVTNMANPTHKNTLDAISRRLGVDVRAAKGGRVCLAHGDQVLVVEIGNIPCETREFTDEELAKATFLFRIVFFSAFPEPSIVSAACTGDGGAALSLANAIFGPQK
jgi:hypothetical protein